MRFTLSPTSGLAMTYSRRLRSREKAAEYCGISKPTFSAWVPLGRLSAPLPGTGRWDLKAIDCDHQESAFPPKFFLREPLVEPPPWTDKFGCKYLIPPACVMNCDTSGLTDVFFPRSARINFTQVILGQKRCRHVIMNVAGAL
jgi:hypothetical protein